MWLQCILQGIVGAWGYTVFMDWLSVLIQQFECNVDFSKCWGVVVLVKPNQVGTHAYRVNSWFITNNISYPVNCIGNLIKHNVLFVCKLSSILNDDFLACGKSLLLPVLHHFTLLTSCTTHTLPCLLPVLHPLYLAYFLYYTHFTLLASCTTPTLPCLLPVIYLLHLAYFL